MKKSNNLPLKPIRDQKKFGKKEYGTPVFSKANKHSNIPMTPSKYLGESTYKGKESRQEGKTRNETRVYSGYAPRKKYDKSTPKIVDDTSLVTSAFTAPISRKVDTSWGSVAKWYDNYLETGEDTYHSKVIFPNILRMIGNSEGKRVLDLACGQGVFAELVNNEGATVVGVDIGKELITIAESKGDALRRKGARKVTYHVGSADDLYMIKDGSQDIVTCILALQNIENLQKTISEVSRVLVPSGRFMLVLNHPSFRNPKRTSWGYDETDTTQYRRVDEYMSESHTKIDMTPGSLNEKKYTVSFHRPLQVYVKALSKSGFAITYLEEWISHKESERGPKQRAENIARKEIPMFMCLESKKL